MIQQIIIGLVIIIYSKREQQGEPNPPIFSSSHFHVLSNAIETVAVAPTHKLIHLIMPTCTNSRTSTYSDANMNNATVHQGYYAR